MALAAQTINILYIVAILGSFFLMMGLVVFVIINRIKYKHRVVIYDSHRQQSADVKKFKDVNNRGDPYHKIMGTNFKMPIYHSKFYRSFGKSGKLLNVIKDGDFFFPLAPESNPGFMTDAAAQRSIFKWYKHDKDEADEYYKKKTSLLLQFAPHIGFVVMCIVFLLMVIFVLKFAGDNAGVSSAAPAAESTGQAITNMITK